MHRLHVRVSSRHRTDARAATSRVYKICCQSSSHGAQHSLHKASRRGILMGFGAALWLASPAVADVSLDIEAIQSEAFEAYGARDFGKAIKTLDELVRREGEQPRWLEMRGQVLVDAKQFDAAVSDFNAAIALTPEMADVDRARLLADRALAYEGLSRWEEALQDYQVAIEMAFRAGEGIDPYILNSRGNCRASLGRWQEARDDYQASAQLFQQARGYRGPNGSTTSRLDGAIFAASNAALMLAQLGDSEGAIKEMRTISRRAPGSSDMRAALAALYWSEGERDKAENLWEFACDQITVGCQRYRDPDWLSRIRRWPPVMVDKMQKFINLADLPVKRQP